MLSSRNYVKTCQADLPKSLKRLRGNLDHSAHLKNNVRGVCLTRAFPKESPSIEPAESISIDRAGLVGWQSDGIGDTETEDSATESSEKPSRCRGKTNLGAFFSKK